MWRNGFWLTSQFWLSGMRPPPRLRPHIEFYISGMGTFYASSRIYYRRVRPRQRLVL